MTTGCYVPARPWAPRRIISTADPGARHGHKTSARGFDGHKGHVAADPDSEITTDTEVSAGNVGDAAVAADLIDDLLPTDTDDLLPTDTDDTDADGPRVYGDAAYGGGRRPRRQAGSSRTCSPSTSTRTP